MIVYWLYNDEENLNINEHGYVGVSNNFKARLSKHANRFKLGFKWKIIFEGSDGECLELERTLRPSPGIGWNDAIGGHLGYRKGHSEKALTKIKIARAKQSAPIAKGRKFTEEHIEKIRLANTGLKRSDEVCARFSIIRKQISDETRLKMSKSSTGRKLSEQAKAKVVAALKARVRTEETREKIRASVIKQWERQSPFVITSAPIMTIYLD